MKAFTGDRSEPRWFAICVFLALAVIVAHGAELEDRTLQAYRAYLNDARRAFLTHIEQHPQPVIDDEAILGNGKIVARAGHKDGIIDVPGGLVHHWIGSAFIADTSLDDALSLARTFDEYPSIYKSIIRSEFLGHEGDTSRVRLRIKEKAGSVNATLDMWSDVRYVRVDSARAYSLTEATEIREVVGAGGPEERLLPAGRDRGYLWRASTFARYTEHDGGVYAELETIGLSRGFPPLMGWVIEPIARRLGRRSVEGSLREFREGLALKLATEGAKN